jgi:hypothetical protein
VSDPLFGSFPQGRQMDAPSSPFGEVLPDATPELLAWARWRFEELDEAVTGVVAARCTTGATRVAAQLPVQSGPFSTIVGLEPDSRRDERQRRQRVDRTRLRPAAP